ncbi:MAG: hypothetical protein LUQ25_04900 [Methanoregulaceae archaeon]|nr:hypothetical protein [Methanoregulaceae archaeon]
MVDSVFQAMFSLTDLRVLLRATAPAHELDPDQRSEAERLIRDLEQQVIILKEELIR